RAFIAPATTAEGDLPHWAVAAVAGLAGVLAIGGWFAGPLLNRILAAAFYAFNKGFDLTTAWYTRAVGGLLRVSALVLVAYGGLLVLTWWGFTKTPTGFIPTQDKGYLLVNVQLPDAASVGRTEQVVQRVEEIALNTRGVKHTVAISGQSILLNANAPNFGAIYLMLDDFGRRRGLSSDVIAARLEDEFRKEVPQAAVNIFPAPPIEGLGTAGGFRIIIQDTNDNGYLALQKAADDGVAVGQADPRLQGVFSSF